MKHDFSTYLRWAFRNWYNYGALALVAGLGLLFWRNGGDGLIMLGGGLELLYLYFAASNPRFQRWVDSELAAEKELAIGALRDALWPSIEDSLRERYMTLEGLTARLTSDHMMLAAKNDPFLEDNIRKVKSLLANYLKIAAAVTRYRNYLSNVDEAYIANDIERLESEILGASERVQEVRRKNIDVLRKRLDKIEKARANCEYLRAQMDTIEDTLELSVDQAMTLSDPKGMGVQIDNLLHTLQETELVAAEMEGFSELEAALEDDVYRLPKERQ